MVYHVLRIERSEPDVMYGTRKLFMMENGISDDTMKSVLETKSPPGDIITSHEEPVRLRAVD